MYIFIFVLLYHMAMAYYYIFTISLKHVNYDLQQANKLYFVSIIKQIFLSCCHVDLFDLVSDFGQQNVCCELKSKIIDIRIMHKGNSKNGFYAQQYDL